MKKVAGLLIVVMLMMLSPSVYAQQDGATLSTDFDGEHQADAWGMAGTPDASTVRIEDGQLLFEGAQDRSYFGPLGAYNSFELAFDLMSFEGNSSWIGVSFGLPQPDAFFGEPEAYLLYIVNDSLYLVRNGASEALDYADPEQRWIPAEHTLVMKEEPLNLKVVYDEGKLQVFYKLQSEGEEAWAEPRAVFENLPEDISGHIQITTSGNDDIQGWFAVDNVRISGHIAADATATEPAEEVVEQQPEVEEEEAGDATDAANEQATAEPPAEVNPDTEDSSSVMFIVAIAAVVVLALIVIVFLRKRKQA